jgi:hypothetical protein
LKRQIISLQQEFDILQQTSKDVEQLLRKELDDLRVDIEELQDLVKVKDRMLDDQNIGIS